MITAEALITLTLKKKKEPTDGTGQWTRDEVLTRLNLFQDIVDLKLGELVIARDTTLVTVSAQREYDLVSTVKTVLSVTIDDEEIDVTTEEDLIDQAKKGQISINWRTDTGDPTHAYQQNGHLYLYPIPITADLTIAVTHKVNLTAMTDSASSYPLNTIERLRSAQLMLVYYAVMDLATEDGDSEVVSAIGQLFNSVFDSLRPDNVFNKKGNKPSKKSQDVQDDDL